MIFYQEKVTQSAGAASINSTKLDVARFHVEAGTIEKFDVWRDNYSPGAAVTFQLRKNGVVQFADVDRPVLAADAAHVGVGGLSIAVADGDVVSIDAILTDSTFGFRLPGYFRLGVQQSASGAQTECLEYALSDETTAITTGLKVTDRVPYGFTVTDVRTSLTAASSSGLVTVDVKEAGTSIFSTLPSIDATETTSATAASPRVISDAALASNAELTLHVTAAGTGAKGLKVQIIGHQ